MSALDRERKTRKLSETTMVNLLVFPVKGGTKIFLGAMVVLSAGFLAPGSAATGLIAVGVAEYTVDNTTGKDGDQPLRIRQGTFEMFNGTGADVIAQADVGKDCYIVDDQTVAKTDAAGTRSRAGKILGLSDDGRFVWVQIGIGL